MACCNGRVEAKETERRIQANHPEYNANFQYANNHINTSKYNLLTFFPLNLFEQFQRVCNAYFLGLLILQLIPQVSSLTPYTTILPLVFVLALSALKDAVDDIQRHRSDNQVNNRKSLVLRDGQLVDELWHKVVVGDIIKLENNQFVAADLFLLSTSEPNSLCYIETAELDGETNLKVKQAIPETAAIADNIHELGKFNGEVISEPPNNNLSKFEGTLRWDGVKYPLDNDKILLRGCVLRNTKWCFGLVVFAGQDTKLMMNSGKTVFKRTHTDRLLNLIVLGIFVFLGVIVMFSTVACGIWETNIGVYFQDYLPWEDFVPTDTIGGATVISVLIIFSYIIVLNTVVPISLYVSVEIIRFVNSWWINWDEKMYYAKNDTPARARTTSLNEELGQIEYIFSDKTGTLTQNVMTFNKCSINGVSFGDYYDTMGNVSQVTETTPKVDFSANSMYEKAFTFYDQRLLDQIKKGSSEECEFFRLLSLCHTVMPEVNDGILEYQAQSPDEAALVSAARNFGFVFKSRTPTTITIEENGIEEVYELLCILDFNNVRKRMSVILRKDGNIRLYCKGADTTVYERLDSGCSDLQELTTAHLNEFASEGLRTLCLAVKDIDDDFYHSWKRRHHEAATSMVDRDEKLDRIYEEIEANMTLIGATAIEDKLQDGVPDCIANLALAGIKIWVLTGDKQETAINIGYSCKLLTDEMEEVFIVDGDSYQMVEKQLSTAKQRMLDIIKGANATDDNRMDVVSYAGTASNAADDFDLELGGFSIVLNGHSLVFGLDEAMELLLLETASMCKTVICCRVTPLQKALVVDLVKRHKKSITLSIGDGANDVSMIKTAHIGVGISGQEGLQAVLASDYSFAQFRYLERLLLVHGRWSYLRMSKFLKYFFYKNFAFTLCHFWYSFFTGFSAQTLYDPAFISMYNFALTSLPVLAMGIFDKILYDANFISLYNLAFTSQPCLALGLFDQDVNEDYSIRYPKLYTPGLHDMLFNKKEFIYSVIEGIFCSVALFFIPYGALVNCVDSNGLDATDLRSFGVVVASILVIAITLKCALDTAYWTVLNHIVIWGSIIAYFIFVFFLYADFFSPLYGDYTGVGRATMSTAVFWFTTLLTVVVILIPVVAVRFVKSDLYPQLSERIRLRASIVKSKSKAKELGIRPTSGIRRSTRSLRSGYAFSHQQGFGNLITSGMALRDSVIQEETEQLPGQVEDNGNLPISVRKSKSVSAVKDSPPHNASPVVSTGEVQVSDSDFPTTDL